DGRSGAEPESQAAARGRGTLDPAGAPGRGERRADRIRAPASCLRAVNFGPSPHQQAGERPMPFATTRDNVRLHCGQFGSGTRRLFVHEFAGGWRAWEPQMRYFARRYRCVTFSFRGYHPSDVPDSPEAYGYQHFRDDVIAVLDHLKIEKAHLCGLS